MASKSKKRRRVFRASCILAALIIAGSSFAWFTSSDEVTNRLSASADYGVRIVESFAPPAEWVPGQTVNKDVYATNTGSIGAYVREDVSGVLTLTKEEAYDGLVWKADGDDAEGTFTFPTEDTTSKITDFVEMTKENAYIAIEAGSYLAYKPAKSTAELGRQVVAFNPDGTAVVNYVYSNGANSYTITEAVFNEVYGSLADDGTSTDAKIPAAAQSATKADWKKVEAKTDFTPDANGLYIFRRIIDVDKYGMEEFDYDGYYFNDGKYYKITDLKVKQDDSVATAPDVSYLDRAGDGKDNDGQLAYATANLLRDKTTVYNEPDKFEYDAANNRLVATYFAKGTAFDWGTVGSDLNEAEHNLAMRRAALDRAIRDNDGANTASQSWLNKAAQLTNELNNVNARLDAIGTGSSDATDTILKTLASKQDGFDNTSTGSIKAAKDAVATAWNELFGSTYNNEIVGVNGDTGTTRLNGVLASNYGTYDEPDTPTGGTAKALADAIAAIKTARTGHESVFEDYVQELKNKYPGTLDANDDYDAVIRKLTVTQLTNTTFSQNPELHNINTLTIDYLNAKAAYEKDKADLADAIKQYRTEVVNYGDKGTTKDSTSDSTIAQITETIGGVEVKYDDYVVSGESGVLGEIARTEAEKSELEAKKTALESAINDAMTEATSALSNNGGTAYSDALNTAIGEYKTAAENYDTKLAAYNAKKKDFDNYKELKIYINLSDDVGTVGGVANRWQLLNSSLDNFWSETPDGVDSYDVSANTKKDTAVFYYTSILEGGESSTKLIDSVTLDNGVTQDMYKYFDYDLNVALKSAQINYADDNETIKSDTTPAELDATATLSNNKDINTAITWSANPAATTTYTASNGVGSVHVTDYTGSLSTYTKQFIVDSGDYAGTYVGTSDSGTFSKLNTAGDALATDGDAKTLTVTKTTT